MEDAGWVTVAKEGFGGYIEGFSVSLLLALILALVVFLASVTVVLFFIGQKYIIQGVVTSVKVVNKKVAKRFLPRWNCPFRLEPMRCCCARS